MDIKSGCKKCGIALGLAAVIYFFTMGFLSWKSLKELNNTRTTYAGINEASSLVGPARSNLNIECSPNSEC